MLTIFCSHGCLNNVKRLSMSLICIDIVMLKGLGRGMKIQFIPHLNQALNILVHVR